MPGVVGGHRLTNGQRAAFCGLRLLGIGATEACAIVATSPRRMKLYVGADWTRREGGGRTKWSGETLARMKAAYENFTIPTEKICRDFKIDRGVLYHLAAHHLWLSRPTGSAAHTLRNMSDERLEYFIDLCKRMPREEAMMWAWKKVFVKAPPASASPAYQP